jgi:UDP-glucuronate 4-epimerase
MYESRDSNFSFLYCDLFNIEEIEKIFNNNDIYIVFHFAAQAGVRYGLINPQTYIKNNLTSFFNILEISRKYKVCDFYYASSSSIYGNSPMDKFSETDYVDNPISLYAATKKSNELIAHSYSSIYGIKTIGLRFFTVYGPWGRPDMAYFDFTNKIIHNQEIVVFNRGNLIRDFTYIDDVIQAILLIMNNNSEIYNIYNIANGNPIKLSKFINIIEKTLEIKAKIKYLEIEAGDVFKTSANIEKIEKYGFKPSNSHEIGIYKFIQWYKNYYK